MYSLRTYDSTIQLLTFYKIIFNLNDPRNFARIFLVRARIYFSHAFLDALHIR